MLIRAGGSFEAIVVGTSAGGLRALSVLLSDLPAAYPFSLIIVQHRAKSEGSLLEEILQQRTRLRIKQADEKEYIVKSTIYVAPPDYHLMVETDKSFSLSSDEPVQYSRPSIDVLFRSAAEVYRQALIGIILTGANNDGASGMQAIHKAGGCTIAQDPDEAMYDVMPRAAINTGTVKHILKLKEIEQFLHSLK